MSRAVVENKMEHGDSRTQEALKQVTQERFEVGVIESYLPAQLSEAELDALIAAAIAATGASSPRDMGKVMAAVKEQAAGRADMAQVSTLIKAKLAG